jgi:hypothetical protein
MNHNYHFHQHQLQQHHSGFPATVASHVPQHVLQTASYKRPRESPTSETDGSWHSSFKRLKVVDESDLASFPSGYPPLQEEYAPQNIHELQHPPKYPSKGLQQTTGQRSSEVPSPVPPCAEYQNMNSLLGNLHLMRRRQGAGDEVTYPPPVQNHPQLQQQLQHHQYPSSLQRQRSKKKVASLRLSSNLY